MKLTLKLKLLSDSTFGRGDGVSGLVDQEIEYDAATGLPFVRGRTLKGLLVEECANILYALQNEIGVQRLEAAAQKLFGSGGSGLNDGGALHVGTAKMSDDLYEAVKHDLAVPHYRTADVLEMFTAIRQQTAVNEVTGVPDDNSLRSSRVLLRETVLSAHIEVALLDDDRDALALLFACVSGLRRGGIGRNRGRGRFEASLEGIDAGDYLQRFELITRGCS